MNNFPIASIAAGALNSLTGAADTATQTTTATGSDSTFAGMVNAGVQQARTLETKAQSTVVDLLRGGGVEVHDAMIATQQSELAFELALQVRNKAVAAYQQMMQMQF